MEQIRDENLVSVRDTALQRSREQEMDRREVEELRAKVTVLERRRQELMEELEKARAAGRKTRVEEHDFKLRALSEENREMKERFEEMRRSAEEKLEDARREIEDSRLEVQQLRATASILEEQRMRDKEELRSQLMLKDAPVGVCVCLVSQLRLCLMIKVA